MFKNIIVVLCLFVSGCVSVSLDEMPERTSSVRRDMEKKDITNIRHIHIGMTKEEVASIMGKDIKVGYKRNDKFLGGYEPIKMKNPYKSGVLSVENKSYDVFYYFVKVIKADGLVSDDELAPFVFQGGKLIGKDWDFFFKLKNKGKK